MLIDYALDDTSRINQLQHELVLRARVTACSDTPDTSRADRIRVQTIYLSQLGIASIMLERYLL
jgi:hypothetical protein